MYRLVSGERPTFALLVIVSVTFLFACNPFLENPLADMEELGPPLPQTQYQHLTSSCGNAEVYSLSEVNGNTIVNYCGLVPCFGPPIKWGEVNSYQVKHPNQSLSWIFDIDLAWGWHVDSYAMMIDSFLPQDSVQVPLVSSIWQLGAHPIPAPGSAYSVSVGAGNWCQEAALRLQVVKLDFFGGTDSDSRRVLWMNNPDWNNPSNASLNSSGPYQIPVCSSGCGVSNAPNPSPAIL